MSNLLNNLPKDFLEAHAIPDKVLHEGVNINHSFFNEIFSAGTRHMMWSTINGAHFMSPLITLMYSTTITDMVLEEIKNKNNQSFFGDFKSDNVLSIPGLKLRYKRAKQPCDHSWEWRYRGYSKVKRQVHLSSFRRSDISWIGWLCWEQIETVPDHPILQKIRNMAADICEKLAEMVIINFHTNIHQLDKKRDYSEEVTIRQTTMMFWSYVALRNALRCNWDDALVTTKKELPGGNESLAFPLEDIANYINGTNFNDARRIYNPEFCTRINKGFAEVNALARAGMARIAAKHNIELNQETHF